MDFKKVVPHLIAVISLAAVAAIFFAPNAFSGKVLSQPDNDKARGMQTEIQHYIKTEGEAPLWTNSAFGGMPSYQIYSPIKGNLTRSVFNALLLWTDISSSIWTQVMLAMLMTYLLLIVLKVDWRIAIFGAVSYGITTYNIDIIGAGHTTKMIALALAPGVLTGLVLAFNGRLLLGGALMALFVAIQVYANHVQITYYTLIISGLYFLAKLVDAIRERTIANWGKALAVCGLAIILGFASNLSRLWPTYEYSQETIRGKSDLTQKKSKGDGLDKDYLFGWSYGIDESLTLLVPHFAGGGGGEMYEDTKLFKAVDPSLRNQIQGLFYSGEQTFVGTAIYFGAIVFFLFVLGAFLVPGSPKYWLLAGGLLMISLAWGKHFFLNYLFYDYLPMFKKFRAVSMALGVGQFCFAMLGALALQSLNNPDITIEKKKKALWWALGITGGLCLVAWMIGGSTGQYDKALENQPQLLALLHEDRADMLRSDVFRSIGFIGVAAALIWFYLQGRIKSSWAVVLIVLFSLADNWMVCSRTLTAKDYESKRAALAPPPEKDYDKQIKQDPDVDYRVLDLSRGGITANATTSYFHKSLSGYHAAKLQRYQEVVDSFFNVDLKKNLHVVGMLNGKYIISQEGDIFPNPYACGNAWFVSAFETVSNADAEINALHRLNPKDTAIILESIVAENLKDFAIRPDSNAQIRLSHYHPDKMEYEYSSATEQLAVFSEVYYPPAKGWNCYLNGQPAPDFFRVDYLLRGMRLPAGQNMKLEMRFEPRSFYLGEKIAYAASGLVLLAFIVAFYFWYRNRTPDVPARLTDMPEPAESNRKEHRTQKGERKPQRRKK